MPISNLFHQSELGGTWVFFVPIYGIKLCKSIKSEFQLNKITLITKSKLSRCKKRFGLSKPLNNYFKRGGEQFESEQIFAIAKFGGDNPDGLLRQFENVLKDELAFLSASQTCFNSRQHNANISLANRGFDFYQDIHVENTTTCRIIRSSSIKGRYCELVLNKNYLDWQRHHGFLLNALDIIRDKTSVKKEMISAIENCIIFLGKSQDSTELYLSFLNNMIALDSILSTPTNGKKQSQSVESALHYLLGWSDLWSNEIKEKVKEIYKLRADLVHDGKRENIKVEDLLFTDQILRNVLFNITKHPHLFQNKKALKDFLLKREAENTLGVKSTILPKSFKAFKMHYSGSVLKHC